MIQLSNDYTTYYGMVNLILKSATKLSNFIIIGRRSDQISYLIRSIKFYINIFHGRLQNTPAPVGQKKLQMQCQTSTGTNCPGRTFSHKNWFGINGIIEFLVNETWQFSALRFRRSGVLSHLQLLLRIEYIGSAWCSEVSSIAYCFVSLQSPESREESRPLA